MQAVCPWCGETPPLIGDEIMDLYHHIYFKHCPGDDSCACGADILGRPEGTWSQSMHSHFEEEGGLMNHYYDIVMGVKHEPS